jgi:hypothetical protein
MGGSGSRAIRVAFVAALVAVMAAAAASVAYSMAFDDGSPCPDRHPLFVCPGGAVGASYSIQLLGHSGCTPYKFANTSGSLPPGLSLTSSGLISGTPTASGTWTPWLQMISHCAGDPTADRQFSFTIDSGLRILTNTLPAGASVGVLYSVTLDVRLVTNLNPLTGSTPKSRLADVVGHLRSAATGPHAFQRCDLRNTDDGGVVHVSGPGRARCDTQALPDVLAYRPAASGDRSDEAARNAAATHRVGSRGAVLGQAHPFGRQRDVHVQRPRTARCRPE